MSTWRLKSKAQEDGTGDGMRCWRIAYLATIKSHLSISQHRTFNCSKFALVRFLYTHMCFLIYIPSSHESGLGFLNIYIYIYWCSFLGYDPKNHLQNGRLFTRKVVDPQHCTLNLYSYIFYLSYFYPSSEDFRGTYMSLSHSSFATIL